MTEQWLPIPGYAKYQVSSLGRVSGPFGVLKQSFHSMGYLLVTLMKDDLDQAVKKKAECVHRLVALAFHEDSYFDGAMALHRDHDKTNNVPGNIYWGSAQDNAGDESTKVSAHVKMNMVKARELRTRRNAGERAVDLADEFGISPWMVANIMAGKYWKE